MTHRRYRAGLTAGRRSGLGGITVGVRMETMTDYEYRVLTFDRHTSKAQARQAVREHAEYGRLGLSRTRIQDGGVRRTRLAPRNLPVHAPPLPPPPPRSTARSAGAQ